MSWTVLYIIDVFAISTFIFSYYKNCYRRGYRFDFWHAQLLLVCVFPNMVLLPFVRSEMNRVILGDDFDVVMAALPSVFLITVVGYFATLLGGSLWRLRANIGVRKHLAEVLDIVPRCSLMLMTTRSVLVFQALLCLCLQAVVLTVYFASSGFGFDLRAFTFANPMFRPVAQTASAYSVLIASHCLARYVDSKERILLVCTVSLTFGMVFFGSRSNLFAIYLGVLACYLVKLRGRLRLFSLALVVALVLSAAFYLGNVRAGQYSLIQFFASIAFLLLYGNNFSDLRDFAWVYGTWDHVFWGGKTYLAALFSFVPRAVSQFRDTWGFGAVTAATAGFDPQLHPGLRPGYFGEGFFNYGLPGVVLVGLLVGLLTRRVDIDTKKALTGPRSSMMRAFAAAQLLQVAGCVAISVNLSGFYVVVGIYAFSWVLLQLFRLTGAVQKPLAHFD
ncbi:MAG TPA: oligosaccharide repeat unit polymerase [Terracidiphilus sp.]|jgi:oligosaccharide repeat unit polymerase